MLFILTHRISSHMDLQRFKANLALRLFAWRYIPVIVFCPPVIEEMNAKALHIRIPLGWLTRNHLDSMYFGALATGADLVGGLLVMEKGRQRRKKVQFDCAAGEEIDAMIDESLVTGQLCRAHYFPDWFYQCHPASRWLADRVGQLRHQRRFPHFPADELPEIVLTRQFALRQGRLLITLCLLQLVTSEKR